MKIQSQNQDVIKVKQVFMEMFKNRHRDALPVGEGDDGTKNRRRVPGIGQPILIEVAVSCPGQAVQKILVLVGVIQRRLGVRYPK